LNEHCNTVKRYTVHVSLQLSWHLYWELGSI